MTGKIPLSTYLFRRLRQYGVTSIFGVPGDFSLRSIDHMKAAGIDWVGTCNELNAGYAADGYARTKGLGALMTTYGVGELSAINATAASFAERVPVVHIVGVPNNVPTENGTLVHHALPARPADVFVDMHKSITAVQYRLDSNGRETCKNINTALHVASKYRQPVYVQLPSVANDLLVNTDYLNKPGFLINLKAFGPDRYPKKRKMSASDLLDRLQNSRFPLLLVDRSNGMDRVRQEINDFVRHSGIATLTMPSGAGMIDHDMPNYFGVHSGPVGRINTMPLIEQADLVLAFGAMFSDTQTLGWTTVPEASKTIHIPALVEEMPRISSPTVTNIDLHGLLVDLKQGIESARFRETTTQSSLLRDLLDLHKLPQPDITDLAAPIDQSSFYTRINSYLKPHDIILLGNATPILGGRDFVLPSPTCRVISSGLSFSIGQMLPAALGAAVAQQRSKPFEFEDPSELETLRKTDLGLIPLRDTPLTPDGRVVLFDGDGSFQVTAQELSTIIRLRLNITIFILNNAGYAYERLIHGLNEDYNDIADWDYLSLPAAFGGREALRKAAEEGESYGISCACLQTWADLDDFLMDERFDNGFEGKGKRGLKLIDVRVGRTDVPERFREVFKKAGEKLRQLEPVEQQQDRGKNQHGAAGKHKDIDRKGNATDWHTSHSPVFHYMPSLTKPAHSKEVPIEKGILSDMEPSNMKKTNTNASGQGPNMQNSTGPVITKQSSSAPTPTNQTTTKKTRAKSEFTKQPQPPIQQQSFTNTPSPDSSDPHLKPNKNHPQEEGQSPGVDIPSIKDQHQSQVYSQEAKKEREPAKVRSQAMKEEFRAAQHRNVGRNVDDDGRRRRSSRDLKHGWWKVALEEKRRGVKANDD